MPTPTTVVSTHTATQQWQSFEMRMRRRRAERYVLRAEVALEAGFEDDAREALDEARRLDSNAPDFDTILATVVVRMREAVAAERAQKRQKLRRMAAAAVVVLASLAGTAALMRDETAPVPGSRFSVPGSGSLGSGSGSGSVTPSTAAERPDAVAVEVRNVAAKAVELAPSSPAKEDALKPEPTNLEAKNPEPTNPEPTNPEPKNPELKNPNREPSTGNREPVATPIATPLSLVDLPSAAPPAVPETAPAEPIVDDSVRVRAVLSQYEAAYSALNVAAARAIWPSVDARSLSRAFEGLDSQRVSLGQCSLAIDGRVARADCHGHASYTPKIGGGTRTETRQWKFELKNADGTWQIVRAEAR